MKCNFLNKSLNRICLKMFLSSLAKKEDVSWAELFISAHCQGFDIIIPASDQFWIWKFDFEKGDLEKESL